MKVKLFSHIADPDGVFPVVLSHLIFDNFDYELLQLNEIDERIVSFLEEIDDYDKVYIVDLNLSREVASIIEGNDEYRKKVIVLDHHIGKIDMNDFSFITVIDTDSNNVKQCGTSLYYNYLLENFYSEKLDTECIRTLVEEIRQLDTWTFGHNKEAKWIGMFLDILGLDMFISYFSEYVSNHDTFAYEEKFQFLFEVEEKRILEYVEKRKEEVLPFTIDGYSVGVIFCDRYTSEVGNFLAEYYRERYDFIILIKISKGRVSYRAVKDEISLPEFAIKYGGNGHKHAAGSPLPENLKDQLVHMIFKEGIIDEC